MANEAEKFGLPQVVIDFKTKSVSAIARSARGIGVMILNNETTNTSNFYKINDVTDIPDTGLTERNVMLIKKALLGTPLRLLVYTLPNKDNVKISLFNAYGALLTYEITPLQNAGTHQHQFDLRNMPQGTYIVKLTTGSYREARSVTISK